MFRDLHPLEAAVVLGPPCSSFSQVDLRDEWSEFIPADMENLARLEVRLAELNAPHISHVLPKNNWPQVLFYSIAFERYDPS